MDSARIEREAADWLAKRDTGDWREADAAAFAQWQTQATAHRIAVIRLQTTWAKADRLQALGAGIPRGQIPTPGKWRLSPFVGRSEPRPPQAVVSVIEPTDSKNLTAYPGPHRAMTRFVAAVSPRAWAATLILAVGTASGWYTLRADPDFHQSAVGEIEVVSLPDGSKITLNTNTAVRVRLSADERHIDLERGEAFFEVAKDPLRPFSVSAAGKRIVAVGTKFSVFRGSADTRVIVTEGRVEVEDSKAGPTAAPATDLPAGSIAQAGSAGVLVKHTSVAEAESYTSWRSGYIALHDTELATAVAEFNRYNTKQLVIGDPSIATLRIGGNLRATNQEAFVRVLEEGFQVHAHDQGDRVVLTGDTPR